ncbi:hypothetical protein BC829DRAFT_396742 [Chytridium lagenaria]|nr:hypothetical protein BC829DRAFT_396742 [Chytridium lagenaria]
MSSQNCGKCDKTVYATEKVEAASKWYHKGCFKCADTSCNIQLNLKTFQAANGAIYCDKHIADPVSVQHAMHAPKKSNEGLHKIQVGTGETPNMTYFVCLDAPRNTAENLGHVQKGDKSPLKVGFGSNHDVSDHEKVQHLTEIEA